MAKYLKITPPKGFFSVVPDTESVRKFYGKLNADLERRKEPLYKIEKATEAEIAEFNPGLKPAAGISATASASDTPGTAVVSGTTDASGTAVVSGNGTGESRNPATASAAKKK
jgi:hypothetical protein